MKYSIYSYIYYQFNAPRVTFSNHRKMEMKIVVVVAAAVVSRLTSCIKRECEVLCGAVNKKNTAKFSSDRVDDDDDCSHLFQLGFCKLKLNKMCA